MVGWDLLHSILFVLAVTGWGAAAWARARVAFLRWEIGRERAKARSRAHSRVTKET